MKMFTKLALVSSIAISANAMAMQSMDDAALSSTTGQDGINIGIGISRVDIGKLFIHDNDGLDKYQSGGSAAVIGNGTAQNPQTPEVLGSLGGAGKAGAIVIKGNGITNDINENNGVVITANTSSLLNSHNLADIRIDTDAGRGTGNTAFLNVAADISGLNINIGEIGVTGSGTAGTGSNANNIRRGGDDSNYNKILSGLTLKTGKTSANIQLGATPQGAMIVLNTTMQGGLQISNLGLLDNSTVGQAHYNSAGTLVTSVDAGEIHLDSIKVADAGGKDLTVNAKVSVVGASTAGGNDGYLKIVAGSTPTDVYISGVHLGSKTAGSIGDVEIQGLQTYYGAGMTPGSVITVSGH